MRFLQSSTVVAATLSFAGAACAQPGAPIDWRAEEQGMLENYTQLTFDEDFLKAGEAYFSPDGNWIIFQAVPAAETDPDAPYQMYVAKLLHNGDGVVTGLGEPIQLSPDGSANTCGWFHPQIPHRVIYGSTIVEPGTPSDDYSREKSRYKWVFPDEMEVVTQTVPAIWDDRRADDEMAPQRVWDEDGEQPVAMWEENGYDAECSYSPDARFLVFTHFDPATKNADLYIRDLETEENWPIVQAPGYDGGPFFSPDGKRLVYRSDRSENDLLQVYVADLIFDETGRPVGVSTEHVITNDHNVNWAPFFHPSGEFLIFATSRQGHFNYEVYSIEVPGIGEERSFDSLASKRITYAMGFDGLPVFSADGALMMWTSQRVPGAEGGIGESQIWVANVKDVRP